MSNNLDQKTKNLTLKENVLKDRHEQGRVNRGYFSERDILCINIMGSPGCGKTSLLELTAANIKQKISVIEGDLQTERDADRIKKAGVDALQITTGRGCHLDAFMIDKALTQISLDEGQVLFIENVGNLVCPASHDLGSQLNVVLLSIPEGDDKVGKYPIMFQKADMLLLTKTDLLGFVPYDKNRVYEDFKKVNPKAPVIELTLLMNPIKGKSNQTVNEEENQNNGLSQWLTFIDQKKSEIKHNNQDEINNEITNQVNPT